MPTIGKGKNKKTFPYTAKGKDDAKKMAKKSGKKKFGVKRGRTKG